VGCARNHLAVRIAAVYDGAKASRALGNGEVPVVNVAAVAAAAATTTPTGRRCQGVRVDVRQRQRRAGGRRRRQRDQRTWLRGWRTVLGLGAWL